jgi:dihydroneopterin aldolase / 2-amino-4-hydroxy-6-hydroxymethyldihydropteridine diphosphokinase
MAMVYIGIGSNLGDKESNCREAIYRLQAAGCRVMKVSSVHITEPWGLRDQPLFANMAIMAETSRPPEDLMSLLKTIESDMGREGSVKWGPRLIDLDILLYGDLIVSEASVSIPHPMLHEREFALAPLAEIAPDTMHPVLKKSIKKLLEEARA